MENQLSAPLDKHQDYPTSNQYQQHLKERHEKLRQELEAEYKAKDSLLNQREQKLKPFGILISDEEQNENDQISLFPENLGQSWNNLLEQRGLYVTKPVANSYLLSLITALYLGRLVLLNGSVGVGKTSIVKHSAKLMGGTSTIIPVRPAWIDPSDLIGFFDPIQEIFRPTPFLTALNAANKHKNKMNLVCLDEINLAKIENYGADLLSCLEYSRDNDNYDTQEQDGLLLYSKDIWDNLKDECKDLYNKESKNFNKEKRLKQLQSLFKEYPEYKFKIPKNLVLLGTLNADETTYDLSPKLIDRSFIISYPPADFENNKNNQNSNQVEKQSSISLGELIREIDNQEQTVIKNINRDDEQWKKVNEWHQTYFIENKLGRPLGYRIKKDYQIFMSVARIMGINTEESLAHFIFSKILPRVFLFKGNNQEDCFKEWLKEIEQYQEYDPANILDNFEQQLENLQKQYISYWG